MVIAIDVGNANIVIGCFKDEEPPLVFRMSTNTAMTADEYASSVNGMLNFHGTDRQGINGAVISSVVPPLTKVFKSAVKLLSGVNAVVVSAGIKTGLNILIDDPGALGGDMVAAAVGALAVYKPPFIIVDMGTATTITVVDKDSTFVGGAIMPGLAVSMNALTDSTSQLPNVPIEAPEKCINGNTIDCMKSGAVFGAAAMIDGMAERFEEELGENTLVIATGELSETVMRHCKREIIYEPNLVLNGLRIIYNKNKRR
ncbi:MAG: type III pantothenate kinase [Defluviitaleaceae bacterium]|nr:type III pantothenate kinase [Defluviitaleaceae bacterium]MCL2836076.1 type III pantothenate kinase [Defluviitaleaceae bacterium]